MGAAAGSGSSRCTWQQLPAPSFGPSGATAHRRFTEWSKARVWAKLHRLVLDELGSRGELDWSRCAIDSVNMRALKGGPDRPESCRPGKNGSKIHLITEGSGLPVSIGISGANTQDSQALIPLIRGIPPIRSRRGPRRRKPSKLYADKAYDYAHLRRWLRQRGIIHRIARKGIESSARLGRHRWKIERTMAWLAGCHRVLRHSLRGRRHRDPEDDAAFPADERALRKGQKPTLDAYSIYALHYNAHHPHQGRGRLLLLAQGHPASSTHLTAHRLRPRVLGGVINEYRYAA
ncbi:IS5 family transposase [Streptomyces sp. NPDC001902]